MRRDESGAEVTVRRAASPPPPPAQLEAHLHCPSLPGSRMCGPDEHTQHDVLILLLSNPEYHAQFTGDTALQWEERPFTLLLSTVPVLALRRKRHCGMAKNS